MFNLVLHRRARESHAVLGLQTAHGLRDLRGGVLDQVRFVQHDALPHEALQQRPRTVKDVAADHLVGDDHHRCAAAAAQSEGGEVGREAHGVQQVGGEVLLHFVLPVHHHRGWTHDQSGRRLETLLDAQHGHSSEGLQTLAEAPE